MIQIKIGTTEWRACPGGQPDAGHVLYTGEFVYQPDGMTPAMVWDDAIGNVRPFDTADTHANAREQQLAALAVEWERRKNIGFSYGGKIIDSDTVARENVSNAALGAMAAIASGNAAAWSLAPAPGWKCQDNTYLSINAQGMLGLHASMLQAGVALFAYAQQVKAAIVAAVDPASIDVTAGWPAV